MNEVVGNRNPLVSIWCLTYNHEKYIRDALEGFVAQKTSFPYEVVIHDDASTDGTMEIVREYQNRYPDLFKVISQKENIYRHPKRQEILQKIEEKELAGKYVAFCEGDDYWIDTHKLQIQVDYLELHPECVMVAHDAILLDCRDFSVKAKRPYEQEKELFASELIMRYNGNIPTGSIVVRKEIIKMDAIFLECGIGDWMLQLYAATKGTVYYFDRIMAVYRWFSEGSWTEAFSGNPEKKLEHLSEMIIFLEKYNRYTNYSNKKYIISKQQSYLLGIMDTCQKTGGEEILTPYIEREKQESQNVFRFWSQVKEQYKQLYEKSYVNNKLIDFAKKHDKIYVWGMGAYSKIVTKQLEDHGIDYVGYVISDNQERQLSAKGKKVWKLCECSFENSGVIVAINPIIWPEISESIDKYNIKSFYCPFLLQFNNF